MARSIRWVLGAAALALAAGGPVAAQQPSRQGAAERPAPRFAIRRPRPPLFFREAWAAAGGLRTRPTRLRPQLPDHASGGDERNRWRRVRHDRRRRQPGRPARSTGRSRVGLQARRTLESAERAARPADRRAARRKGTSWWRARLATMGLGPLALRHPVGRGFDRGSAEQAEQGGAPRRRTNTRRAPGKSYSWPCAVSVTILGLATGSRLTAEQWKGVVNSMVDRGAIIPDEDAKAIVEYLAAHFGPRSTSIGRPQGTSNASSRSRRTTRRRSCALGTRTATSRPGTTCRDS